MEIYWNQQFWATNLSAGTYIDTAQQARMNEFMFSDFLSEFIPHGLSATLGLLWRLISYYPYLFIGAIILPRWIRKRFGCSEAAKVL